MLSDRADEQVLLEAGPQLTLTKQGKAPDDRVDAGDVVDYTYSVENTGNVRLQGPVTVSDDRADDESCPALTTVGNQDGFLDPGEKRHLHRQRHRRPGRSRRRLGHEHRDGAARPGTDSNQDQETVPLGQAPHLTLVKDGHARHGGGRRADAGDVVTYTLTATNDGNVTLDGRLDLRSRRWRRWSAISPSTSPRARR